MKVHTSLYELFGDFAKTEGKDIKYLIYGDTEFGLTIYDLTDMVIDSNYDFEFKNIYYKNKYEHDHIYFKPKLIFGGEIKPFIPKFDDLVNIIKRHYRSNNYNTGIINYGNIYPEILRELYQFRFDKISNTVYSPGSCLQVKLDLETNTSIFSNLPDLDLKETPIDYYIFKYISLDQYKAIKYIVDNLK